MKEVDIEEVLHNTNKQYSPIEQLKFVKTYISDLKAENERLKKFETIYYLNQCQASDEELSRYRQSQIQQSINVSNLLQQLKEKDQAIECLQYINKSSSQTCENDRKEIERLENIGKEKDQEIEKLKEKLRINIGKLKATDFIDLCLQCGLIVKVRDKINNEEALKTNTKQVCDKIREELDNFEYDCDITYSAIIEIIDKVEKSGGLNG